MASARVERLLHDTEMNRVTPVRYSRMSISTRVVLLMVFVLRALLDRR